MDGHHRQAIDRELESDAGWEEASSQTQTQTHWHQSAVNGIGLASYVNAPQKRWHLLSAIYGGHGRANIAVHTRHDVSNTFLVAAASVALQKTRRQTSMPTMENSVIAAAAEATRRCRIWHMRVARALDAH